MQNITPDLDLKLTNQKGEIDCLGNYAGKYVLVYFYPEDGTPGCTKEACNFRDDQEYFTQKGIKVIGVSPDSVDSHQKFITEHKLNFDLWADPAHKLADNFGVWQEKSLFGKKYMGIVRSTFLIDPEGMIVKVWEKVNPLLHSREVKSYLASIELV